jgi:hypothetical protein
MDPTRGRLGAGSERFEPAAVLTANEPAVCVEGTDLRASTDQKGHNTALFKVFAASRENNKLGIDAET